MNQQNAKEFLPLIQALANGKTIQCNDRGEWVDVDSLYTETYGPDEYRIKPEPRTFKVYLNTTTGVITDGDNHTFVKNSEYDWEHVTVMEVTK